MIPIELPIYIRYVACRRVVTRREEEEEEEETNERECSFCLHKLNTRVFVQQNEAAKLG